MKICILCHFFQDFNIFLFHPKTRVAWGPYLSLLPEVVVLQDEHVIWDLRRLSISVTRTYVSHKVHCSLTKLLHFAKLLGVMAPSVTSMGFCHPNPPPRQMLYIKLWCCIQHFWVVRRFKCISELIFVTTKLLATLLGSSSVYVTKWWRAWKWRNWITAAEQSLAFWQPHICMLMLSYAHIQWHCLTISRYWASSVSGTVLWDAADSAWNCYHPTGPTRHHQP